MSQRNMNKLLLFAFIHTLVFVSAKPIDEQSVEEVEEPVEVWKINQESGLNLIEGDILPTPSSRNAFSDPSKYWTNNEVPFVLEGPYSYDERLLISKALAEFAGRTDVTFRKKTFDDSNYVSIYRGSGCYSDVGMMGGSQRLSIGDGCFYTTTVQHEAMHTLGIWHEQSRYDRDNYVTIMYENIEDDAIPNFAKNSNDTTTNLGTDYDFSSIMHYGTLYFSKNGLETIVANPGYEEEGVMMGQREAFSSSDLIKIRTLYPFPAATFVGWSNWSMWSECDANCQQYRWRWCNSEPCEGEDEETQTCSVCKDCGQLYFNSNYGLISSPLHPANYDNDVHCSYTVQGQDANLPIFLTFVRFGIESSTDCSKDNLTIYEGDSTVSNNIFCGDDLPPDQYVVGDKLTVNFQSDSAGTDIGYQLLYMNAIVLWFCPFEKPVLEYGWTQDTTDDYDWTQVSGGTPSSGTGPTNDHTMNDGNGQYVYFETSNMSGQKTAKLISHVFEPLEGVGCLQFAYHMYGDYIGQLDVVFSPINGNATSIFTRSYNQGNQWLTTKINLPVGVAFQLRFEATRGGGYLSDIAFDDVAIFGQTCEEVNLS